jgi:DNA polymerase
MNVITIDFETFYSQKFSLSKMTTEEYIRDSQFETIGVAVRRNDEDTEFFSGTKEQTKEWLGKWEWDDAVAVAHNAAFDMAILNWHFDIRPKRIADTLSMLRAIDGPDAGNSLAKAAERYGLGVKGDEVTNALGKKRQDFTREEMYYYAKYCMNDVKLTYDLFKRIAAGFPASELRLIDLTIRMFTEPVLELDKWTLTSHLVKVQNLKTQLLNKAVITKENLMSNPKLAETLTSLGVTPPMKISPTTGKETFAFAKNDEEFKALLEHDSPIVQAIVAARLGVKSTLEETRTERFIKIAERGTLPVPLRYYAAHTGRWGGDDKVNLQNLPRKSPLKKAMLAPEGYTFIDCDSSQIEARTLAWLAGQDDLVEFFDKNNAEVAAGVKKEDMQYDPYKIMASQIYGKPVHEINEYPERFVGKTTILGAGYGMGAVKFKAQLKTMGVDLPLEECERIIHVYRATYPMIPLLWQQAGRALKAMMRNATAPLGCGEVLTVCGTAGIKLPNSLSLKYPNLREKAMLGSSHKEMVYDTKKGRAVIPTRIYGGKLVENVCQALARIIIGEQMLMIARSYRVVMTVHDAVGVIAPTEKADEARRFVEDCMRIRPKWATALPLNCESKMGASYGG